MRTYTLVFLMLLAPGWTLSSPAHAQFVFSAGPNVSQLSDVEFGSSEATFDNSTGWHAGLAIDVPLGPVAVQPGLRYMDAGTLFEELAMDDFDPEEDINVTLLEVPLNLRLRLNTPKVTPYVMAGPVLRIPLTPDGEMNDDLKTLSVAGGIGAGLEVSLVGLTLYPELRYTFGISDFVNDDFELDGRTFTTESTQRLNAIMLSVGLGL